MERNWKYRRIAFFGIVGACLALFCMIIWIGSDTMLNREGLQAITAIIIACIAAYFGGSILDDRFKGKEIIAQSAVDQATPSTSETSVEVKS
jgi:hypothetical protein